MTALEIEDARHEAKLRRAAEMQLMWAAEDAATQGEQAKEAA